MATHEERQKAIDVCVKNAQRVELGNPIGTGDHVYATVGDLMHEGLLNLTEAVLWSQTPEERHANLAALGGVVLVLLAEGK